MSNILTAPGQGVKVVDMTQPTTPIDPAAEVIRERFAPVTAVAMSTQRRAAADRLRELARELETLPVDVLPTPTAVTLHCEVTREDEVDPGLRRATVDGFAAAHGQGAYQHTDHYSATWYRCEQEPYVYVFHTAQARAGE
jgi:hypothetical protein